MRLIKCKKCGCARHGIIKSATIVKQTESTQETMKTMPLCYACFVEGIGGVAIHDIKNYPRIRITIRVSTLMKMVEDKGGKE